MLVWTGSAWTNVVINVLLGIWIGVHLFGFLLGGPNADKTSRMYRFAKMAGSLTLVLIALAFWVGAARLTPLSLFSSLIFLGVVFGFLGDMTLAGVLGFPYEVILGMLWFGIGHALYIAAFLKLSAFFGLNSQALQLALVAIFVVIGAAMWRRLIYSPDASPTMNYGALGYGLLLAAMTGIAISVALQKPAFVWMAVGAVLFMASDVLLGNVLFRKNTFPLSRDIVWILYAIGQLLIVFSNAAALGLAK
jgi:hypothetical protein